MRWATCRRRGQVAKSRRATLPVPIDNTMRVGLPLGKLCARTGPLLWLCVCVVWRLD